MKQDISFQISYFLLIEIDKNASIDFFTFHDHESFLTKSKTGIHF